MTDVPCSGLESENAELRAENARLRAKLENAAVCQRALIADIAALDAKLADATARHNATLDARQLGYNTTPDGLRSQPGAFYAAPRDDHGEGES